MCVHLSGVRAKYDDSVVKYTSTRLFLLLGLVGKARFKSLSISACCLNTPAMHMIQCRQGSHVSAFVLQKTQPITFETFQRTSELELSGTKLFPNGYLVVLLTALYILAAISPPPSVSSWENEGIC